MSWLFNRYGRRAKRAKRATSRARVSGGCALGIALFVYALMGSWSLTVQAGQARTVRDGVYSNAQAARGQALFKERCVICHAETLKGGLGPPLVGDEFLGVWGNQP